MQIRQVNQNDYESIYQLVKEAFQTAKVSDGTEQDFVLKLREENSYIPELELVAEENNQLIGHIMFTKQTIKTTSGDYIGLLVAPLCVKLEKRNQGIGKQLMYAGFKRAEQLGYTAAFLLGDFQYYKKFGFKPIKELKIENKTPFPEEHVLGCEIVQGSLKNISGYIENLG